MTACLAVGDPVEAEVDRIRTQYRESPNLLAYFRHVLGQIADAQTALCRIPAAFDLDTAVGDQLTILGKDLGFPRRHCQGQFRPVFGFGANGFTGITPSVGPYYLDVAGQRVYGPKTNGAWPTGVSFTGSSGLQTIAPWATGTAYTVGPPASFVSQGGASYACRVSHTAGTFATDLGAGKWGLVAAKGQDGNGTGTVSTTGSVTAGRLAVFADNTGTLIADGGASVAEIKRSALLAIALGG